MANLIMNDQAEPTDDGKNHLYPSLADLLLHYKNSSNLDTILPRVFAGKSVAPTVNDDSGDGYAISDRWLDETNKKEYVALDVTVGAAVWVDLTSSGAVDSVFGRTGAVVAQSGDYETDEVTESTDKNYVSDAQKTKLDGIEAGAEVNPDLMSQSEGETGTETAERVINSAVMKAAIIEHSPQGEATAYTPVFTGITLGNGTVSGSYVEIGKKISGYASIIFGSTTAVTGSVTVTLPKDCTGHVIQPLGLVTIRDTGLKQISGIIHGNTASAGLIRYFRTDTNYVSQQNITTSLPFTMGEGDAVVIQLEYIGA